MRLAWILLVACAACGGGTSDHTSPDASGGGGGDAPRSDGPATDSAIDGPPVTGGAHTLFLNTEGVMLTPGSDDPTMNKSSLISSATTLKPWLVGDAARATKIATLVTEIRTTLAPYNISIVNTRPAAGPYQMLVLTDTTATAAGFGSGAGGALPFTCTTMPSVVTMLFSPSYANLTATQARDTFASYAVASFAIEAGVPQSSKPQDCMCYSNQACTTLTGPCTIGGAGTGLDSFTASTCGVPGTTMDEAALFLAAFGPHP